MGRWNNRSISEGGGAIAVLSALTRVLLLCGGVLLSIGNEHAAVLSLSEKLPNHPQRSVPDSNNVNNNNGHFKAVSSPTSNNNRREFLRDQSAFLPASLLWAAGPKSASAAQPKSRTEGYEVQRTEREWAYVLSGSQYNILRKGGTERQKSSILNTFTSANEGAYICAACPSTLFVSDGKFSSGTGWPSFASATSKVEAESKDPISAFMGGSEVRCETCGGHLGDLFKDGKLFPGTQAFETGNRYCIDGAALVFKPSGGGDDIFGDLPPPNKVINYEQSMFRDNSINSRQ